jgi:hypothetical protein
MAKKTLVPAYDDVLANLGSRHFAVAPASPALRQSSGATAVMVSQNGCAAEIAPGPDGGVRVLTHPGKLLGGEVARLVDHGYQKFFETARTKVPATADALIALHTFTEVLTQALGGISLYNQSLGTTSDVYMYDRVKGRA